MAIACAMIAACGACDRRSKEPGPATQPIQIARPTTAPSRAAQPACLLIDGQRVNFAPATLLVKSIDDQVVATLGSGDDSSASNANRFTFRMPLDADDAKSFIDADWHCVVRSSEPEETPYGIFLANPRCQLHPVDARVSFEKTPDAGITLVSMSGKFLEVNLDNALAPQRTVTIAAEFEAATTIRE